MQGDGEVAGLFGLRLPYPLKLLPDDGKYRAGWDARRASSQPDILPRNGTHGPQQGRASSVVRSAAQSGERLASIAEPANENMFTHLVVMPPPSRRIGRSGGTRRQSWTMPSRGFGDIPLKQRRAAAIAGRRACCRVAGMTPEPACEVHEIGNPLPGKVRSSL